MELEDGVGCFAALRAVVVDVVGGVHGEFGDADVFL